MKWLILWPSGWKQVVPMTDDTDPKEQALLLRQAAEDAMAERGKWQMLAENVDNETAREIAEVYADVWEDRAEEVKQQLVAFKAQLDADSDE